MNEFYMQRHYKLWEDDNKLLNRVVFLTVAISLALLIKVLIPFVDFSGDKKPVIQAIEILKFDREITNKKIEIISQTEMTLDEVNKFISLQPWQKNKKALIKRYKDMRVSPPVEGYSKAQYQSVADTTINEIDTLLRENILTPLQHSIVGDDTGQLSSVQLVGELESLNQFIVDWKAGSINKNWYRTIQGKDRKMRQLTNSINSRLKTFSRAVKRELVTVQQAKLAVDNELSALNNKITFESDKLKSLDIELQKILPEWLRGLVQIEQVIQLLPAILMIASLFVVAIGVKLTGHYNSYTDGKNFSKEIADDPAMSSIWTLIYRGYLGTILTIAAYLAFIIISWMLFEKSMFLLLEWLTIDTSKAWITSLDYWECFLWISRVIFVALLAYTIARLKRLI